MQFKKNIKFNFNLINIFNDFFYKKKKQSKGRYLMGTWVWSGLPRFEKPVG